MNLTVLLHTQCLALIIFGLINISHSKNDVPTYSPTSYPPESNNDQTYSHQRSGSSHPSTKSPTHQHHANSYTMLSQAISQAVNHEFSKQKFFFIYLLN